MWWTLSRASSIRNVKSFGKTGLPNKKDDRTKLSVPSVWWHTFPPLMRIPSMQNAGGVFPIHLHGELCPSSFFLSLLFFWSDSGGSPEWRLSSSYPSRSVFGNESVCQTAAFLSILPGRNLSYYQGLLASFFLLGPTLEPSQPFPAWCSSPPGHQPVCLSASLQLKLGFI